MNQLPPTVRLLSIGWYFAVCIVGGVIGGYFLDQAAGTTPLLTLLGMFLGLAFAFYGGYRMLMDTLRPNQKHPDDKDTE